MNPFLPVKIKKGEATQWVLSDQARKSTDVINMEAAAAEATLMKVAE